MTTERNIIIHAGQTFELSLDYAGTAGRGQRMHIRASDAAADVIAILSHNGDANARVIYDGSDSIDVTIGASVSGEWLVGANRVEWVYDIEDYDLSDADDVVITHRGKVIVYGNRTRPAEIDPAPTPNSNAPFVRWDIAQTLTDEEKEQARDNIGAGTGGGGGSVEWGDVTGTLADQTDLNSALSAKAPLASPTFTGTPAAPTAAGGTSTTQIATTAFVGSAVSTHAGATDPHGDRAYADGLASNYATATQGALADSAVQDVAAEIHAATADAIADADEIGYWQSVGSALRKITWSNIKATLKTYFDTLYAAISHTHALSGLTDSGATSGQVPTWNGSAWVPQTPSGASPGGSSGQAQYNDAGAFAGLPVWREDANTVAQRNGSTAQVAYYYRDATDTGNYERLAILPGAAAGWMQIVAQTAGTGTDNIGIALTPAGTGAISAQVPDSTATGGNARGAGAVDWQMTRSAANMVASGARAVIGGGSYNRASGDGSVVAGGGYAIASGYYSAIAGGINCTASGAYALAAMYGCTASGLAAFALGYQTTASGVSSWALGQQSTTRGLTCAYAYSSGQRSALGDAQVIGQQVRRTTTDSTPVALATDGTPAAATVMVLPANSAMTVSALVVARDSAGNVTGWRAEALFKRDGSNNTTRLGSATVTAIGTPDAALSAATIDLVANNTLESAEIQVTGVAATTIYWVGELKCVQVA